MSFNLTSTGLERFVEAQNLVYDSVCNELALGEKTSHWMWFVFPQLKELGRSPIAKHYGIESREEALAYWLHPILRARLMECTKLVLAQPNTTTHDIFGSPDDLKFKSCMTLFSQVAAEEPVFEQALERFCGGKHDEAPLKLLQKPVLKL
jgi:uncharacterized protein (DUF1810 family)